MSAIEFFNKLHGNEQMLSKTAVVSFAEKFHNLMQQELINSNNENDTYIEEKRKGLDLKHIFGVNLGIPF